MKQKTQRMKSLKVKNMNIKKGYTQETITLSKRNIDQYIRPKWHRDFRENHVKSIVIGLADGNHFSEPITVNAVNGKRTILNGNHRIEALKRLLKRFPNFTIEVTIKKYHTIDHNKELEIYRLVNKTKAENGLDNLKAHFIDDKRIKSLSNQLPLRMLWRPVQTGDKNALTVTQVLTTYLCRKGTNYALNGRILASKIKGLTEHDIERMVKFFTYHKKNFGEFNTQNPYTKMSFMASVAKIYFNNVGVRISEKALTNKLERFKNRNTASLLAMMKGATYSQQQEIYRYIMRSIDPKGKLISVMEE